MMFLFFIFKQCSIFFSSELIALYLMWGIFLSWIKHVLEPFPPLFPH